MKIAPLVGKIHSSLEILMLIDLPLLAWTTAWGWRPAKKLSARTFFKFAFS
jgi:hypothetical protein